MKTFSRLILFLSLIALTSSVFATVKPNGLFSDNAVLQRDMIVPVWGTANDGELVTVSIQGQKVSTRAVGGHWLVRLRPLKAGGPYTMRINDIEIKNILVGEVWLASGQSNMRWSVKQSEEPEKNIAECRDAQLRLYSVPRSDRFQELPAAWQECTPESVPDFSAVAYFFGRELRKTLRVPVGLIQSAVGGTPAEAWTSRSFLLADADLRTLVENPVTRVSYLYNGMIAPLQPYAIRGVIWYQGESNAGRAYQYRRLFPAMIRNWRQAWGQGDFPFLFVQLAPFGQNGDDDKWPELREAQVLTALTVPKTAMVVITDYGDCTNIHPKPKEPVGKRLALAARAVAYGENITYSGPIYKHMTISGNRVILSFDHVGSGLMAKGSELKGFTIAGPDRKFVPAKAMVQDDKVVVWSDDVDTPTAVRYGWSNCPDVNLFNKEGLPASPFRTDDWPLITQTQ